MTTLKVCEIDLATGEEVVREMNAAELVVMEADKELKAQELKETAARNAAKAELLARLGITEDEAKLLIG
jgi:hypothetical protein